MYAGYKTEKEFYSSSEWRSVRAKVLKTDNYECQICKENGLYSKADTVHHVNHLKSNPKLALSKHYASTGADGAVEQKRNLISVCKTCHETVCHKGRLNWKCEKQQVTEERWD